MHTHDGLLCAILTLSLLTVMAAAAVAPALGMVQAYFCDANPLFIQMILSLPALFIIATNLLYPRISRVMGVKAMTVSALLLYIGSGVCGGMSMSIGVMLVTRALLGVSVGILMPLSTGLLSYYYPPEAQDKLMGSAAAMNQIGGVTATLVSGFLALVSWRASFLVYLFGAVVLVPCLLFLPDGKLRRVEGDAAPKGEGVFRQYWPYVVAMALVMAAFYVYPTNFSIITRAEGALPDVAVGPVMAGLDAVAALASMAYGAIKRRIGENAKYLVAVFFFLGYALLSFPAGWGMILLGSACIGFANGIGVPMINAAASRKAGKQAATRVMPMLSAALYCGQFFSPLVVFAVRTVGGKALHLPYFVAMGFAILSLLPLCRSRME